MMNPLGALAVSSALNLQRSTAVAQVITFTNPTPAYDDICSSSVATVDPVRVLIAAPDEDTSASDAGAAYLFSAAVQTAAAPNLTIRLTPPNTVAASCSSPSTGWTLQQNTNGVASAHWSNAPGTIQVEGAN